ncbi:MAG: putative DNA binding domain-containing protein [Bacteroidales bacterium]|nr:putative DNA binding domain-containing protein [Bacteroidales bacterium]MBR1435144.1 putative DNA binding domain-containing protein [Bacteroidales bacterium]
MSTIAELSQLREREDHVEFKDARHNYPFAGGERRELKDRRHCVLGYVVALANEKGGRLILGMADEFPHVVVGSDFAKGEVGNLVDEIYDRLHIRVHAEELYQDGLRVLVLNVPSRPVGKALRFEGVPLMRLGESLREMDDAEYFSIISEQDPDFSARKCDNLNFDDLDEEAVNRLRNLISDKRGNKDLLTVPVHQFLSDLGLYRDGALTYAALVLLGKSEAKRSLLPQDMISVEFRSSHSQDRFSARMEFRLPLVIAIDRVWEYINHPASNPILQVNDMPRIIDVVGFNEETVREAILNACIHRSFQLNGDVVIKIYPDCLEVRNPGGFPFGVNLGNILTVSSSPRNRLLVETLEKTGFIERSGQGADIMFGNCAKEGKPLPNYNESDDYQVCLKIRAVIENPKLAIFFQSLGELDLNAFEFINIYYVYKAEVTNIYPGAMDRLVTSGFVSEDPDYRYTMGPLFYSTVYKDISDSFGPEVIRRINYAAKVKGGVPSSKIISSLSDLETTKRARTIISKLCDSGRLSKKGTGRSTTYIWID